MKAAVRPRALPACFLPLFLVAAILLWGIAPLRAASYAIFLKATGVEGESMDVNHKGWSDAMAFQHGHVLDAAAQNPVPQFQDLVVYKMLDKASAALQLLCAAGTRLPELNLDIAQVGDNKLVIYQIRLLEVAVTSYSLTGDAVNGGVRPTEVVRFAFRHIAWKYTPIGANGAPEGNICGFYDLLKGAGGTTCF